MTAQEKLARILRAKPEKIKQMEEKMSALTGKQGVIENLMIENEHRINKILEVLGCHDYRAENVSRALITKLQEDDRALYELFKRPSGTTTEGLKTLFNFALELTDIKPLFLLKLEKAKEFLKTNPPSNIIKALKYKNVDELLQKENLIEVFCALRFVETNEWMHKSFDSFYPGLKPEDFERRKIDLRVLSGKWLKIAEKFVKKKYHNISHLKELGVIFVIPLKIDTPGETLRLFSLILHYLHEVEFYSKLFERASKEFGKKIISLLKGEVLEKTPEKGMNWLIIQQYLAKDNPNDPRLFIPHINPEALHWQKAEKDMSNLGERYKDIDLEDWLELDWVGGFFREELVSFDLVDTVMALVKKQEENKYLYHHQEALWNEIFERYMGDSNLEKILIDNFDKGYVTL